MSSDRQEREATIESQIEASLAVARALPESMLVQDLGRDVFADDGFHGGTLDRPAMTRLRALLRLGAIDAVVVYEIDRLSRDEPDLYALVYREIIERKVVLYIAKTGARFEDTDEGHLLFALFAAFARLERRRIGERARRGGKHRASAEGRKNGGIPSYGFDVDDGRFIVNVEEAAWCRRMAAWLAEGITPGRIANRLSELAIPTKFDSLGLTRKGLRRKPGTWYPDQVRRILTDRLYGGEFVYHAWDGDEIVVPVPPMFSQAEIEEHRRIVERNRSLKVRADGPVNILRSLVHCGECGRRYVAGTTGRGTKTQRIYRCGVWHRPKAFHDCANKGWTAKRLEGAVWRAVADLILDPQSVLAALEAKGRDTDLPELRITQLENRLAAIDTEDETIRRGFRAGGIYTVNQAQAELARSQRARALLQRELEDLRRRVIAARNAVAISDRLEATLSRLRDRLPDLTHEQRGAVLRELVDRVTVTGQRIEVEVIVPQERDHLAAPTSGSERLVIAAR